MIQRILKRIKKEFIKPLTQDEINSRLISDFKRNGSIPWTKGYIQYKWQEIDKAINNDNIITAFRQFVDISKFGKNIDERIIEYPWIFANISDQNGRLLDAGSTFNYKTIVEHKLIKNKELSILTYYPEDISYNEKRISYVYSDLRDIPFKENYFDEIVCHSTLEHIDMDNSMYGYSKSSILSTTKNYEFLKVIHELNRVLKNNGTLLITVPYGTFENHGFFQQFDSEMISKISSLLQLNGKIEEYYFKYIESGWTMSTKEDCDDCRSYNPHTGIGKSDDNAAHSRAICCLKFTKA